MVQALDGRHDEEDDVDDDAGDDKKVEKYDKDLAEDDVDMKVEDDELIAKGLEVTIEVNRDWRVKSALRR